MVSWIFYRSARWLTSLIFCREIVRYGAGFLTLKGSPPFTGADGIALLKALAERVMVSASPCHKTAKNNHYCYEENTDWPDWATGKEMRLNQSENNS